MEVVRGQAADTLRMAVVRDMVSDPLVVRKLIIMRLRKSLLNLEVGEGFFVVFFFFKWLTVKIGMARIPCLIMDEIIS